MLFTVCMVIIGCHQEHKDAPLLNVDKYGKLNPKAPIETKQFGQLVGKWDVISSDSISSGGWHESKATWTFRYILDGFAVQDVWHEKAVDKTNNTINLDRDFKGTNIRVYDPIRGDWQCAWIENGANTLVAKFTANGTSTGSIEMVTPDSSGLITFYNIGKDHFDWKYEALGGAQKVLYSKMIATKIE